MEDLIIAAHQPNFLPYLGLFYKIWKSNKFIFVDDVQFTNQNGISHHRNYIKTPQGKQFIRVPVKRSSTSLIKDVPICYDTNWIEKMEKTLYLNYHKAEHYKEVNEWFFDILYKKYDMLSDLNITLIKNICDRMGIEREYDISSKYSIPGKKEDMVVNLIDFFDGSVYYSGTGASTYLHEESFEERGMRLVYSDYEPVTYKQLWGESIENLSVIDFLFNCGFENPFK